jgi:hypothetical protein
MSKKKKGEPKREGAGILTPADSRAIEQRRNEKSRKQERKMSAQQRRVHTEKDGKERVALIARAEKKGLVARYAKRYDLTEDEVRKLLDAELRRAQRAGTRGAGLAPILSAWETNRKKH